MHANGQGLAAKPNALGESMKRVLFVAVLITAVVSAAQITPEEKLIRETYAKLQLALQINAVQNTIWFQRNFADELKANQLEVRLSDFRVGPVSDFKDEIIGSIVSRQVGQPHIQTSRATHDFSKMKKDLYSDVYATAEWVEDPQFQTREWDTAITVDSVVEAFNMSYKVKIARIAAYTITVTFQGVSQTRKATWSFGTKANGEPGVWSSDWLVRGIGDFRNQTVYPEILLDDPDTRKLPVVDTWLQTVAQDCPGNAHNNCYDATTGKAGFSRDDIARHAAKQRTES
jgi:hypothetical protein